MDYLIHISILHCIFVEASIIKNFTYFVKVLKKLIKCCEIVPCMGQKLSNGKLILRLNRLEMNFQICYIFPFFIFFSTFRNLPFGQNLLRLIVLFHYNSYSRLQNYGCFQYTVKKFHKRQMTTSENDIKFFGMYLKTEKVCLTFFCHIRFLSYSKTQNEKSGNRMWVIFIIK